MITASASERKRACEHTFPVSVLTKSRCMVEPGKTVLASCWWDIEQAVPRKKHPRLYAKYSRLLEERRAARAAVIEPLIAGAD